jgi:hypothetical protein
MMALAGLWEIGFIYRVVAADDPFWLIADAKDNGATRRIGKRP